MKRPLLCWLFGHAWTGYESAFTADRWIWYLRCRRRGCGAVADMATEPLDADTERAVLIAEVRAGRL